MGKSKHQKKPKNELVFDNKKREEFLKGFSKRKQQRKKKAQDENERKLKEEQKRIRNEVSGRSQKQFQALYRVTQIILNFQSKNLKDKFKLSYKPIAELEEVLKDSGDSEQEDEGFETEDVKVTISAIKPEDLVKKHFIGYRKAKESDSEQESVQEESKHEANAVPGMEISSKASKKSKVDRDKEFEKLTENLKSEKDVKKLVSRLGD